MVKYKINYSIIGGTKRKINDDEDIYIYDEDIYIKKLDKIINDLEKKTINYNAEYFYNNLEKLLRTENFDLFKFYLCGLYNINDDIEYDKFFFILRELFKNNKDKLFQDFMKKFEFDKSPNGKKYFSFIYDYNFDIYKLEDFMLFDINEISSISNQIINKFKEFHKLDEKKNSERIVIKMILEKNSKIIYFGDYHSSVHSLITSIKDLQKKEILDYRYKLQKDYYIVFLGDLVDRGPYGIELFYMVLLLFLINNVNEYRLIILNGNHEESDTYSRYGLSEEMKYQFNLNQNNSSIKYELEGEDDHIELEQNNLKRSYSSNLKFENDDINLNQDNSSIKDDLEISDSSNLKFKNDDNDLNQDDLERSDSSNSEFEYDDLDLKNLKRSDSSNLTLIKHNILEEILKFLPLALFVKIGNKINNNFNQNKDYKKQKLEEIVTSSSSSENLDENIILNENDNYSKWYQFCHGGIDFVQYSDQFKDFLNNDNIEIFDIPDEKELDFGIGFMWSDFTFNDIEYNYDPFKIFIKDDENIFEHFMNFFVGKERRALFYKNEVKDLLNYLNIETIISGHQDRINYGIVCDYNSNYFRDNFYDNQKNNLNLYELKFNNELVKEITFNINMNNIYASVISSAIISRGVTHSVYGELFLYEDLSKITFISDCNNLQKNKYFLESKSDIKTLIFEKLKNLDKKNYIIEINFDKIYHIENSILKENVYVTYSDEDEDDKLMINEDIKIIFQYIILNIIKKKNINIYIKLNHINKSKIDFFKFTFSNFTYNEDTKFIIFTNFDESQQSYTKLIIHDDYDILLDPDINKTRSINDDNVIEQNYIKSTSNTFTEDEMIQENYGLNLDNIFSKEEINPSNVEEINPSKVEEINPSKVEEINPSKIEEIYIFYNIYESVKFFLDRLQEIIEN